MLLSYCHNSPIRTLRVGLTHALGLMKRTPLVVATAYLQFTSPTGDGFQLEICAGTEAGDLQPDIPTPLATILSDNAETRWVEFYTTTGPVRIPLAELERAIQVAKADVHGEAWYDRPRDEA